MSNPPVNDPLDGYHAPKDENELILNLAGQTHAQLKEIDDNVISPSANLRDSSSGLKRVFADAYSKIKSGHKKPVINTPLPQINEHTPEGVVHPSQTITPPPNVQPQNGYIPASPQPVPPPPAPPQPPPNNGQLELDLSEKGTIKDLYDITDKLSDDVKQIKLYLKSIVKLLENAQTQDKK